MVHGLIAAAVCKGMVPKMTLPGTCRRSTLPGTARVCLLACLAVGLVGVSPGRSGGAAAADSWIPLAEVEPGMKGYGLTVFSGSAIDTFSVEVIGVQRNVRADGSLILVEVAGHGLELSSIAQGMSGSPVYLDGRFAGALAFGWGGSLRPIAGVTPAADILALPPSPQPQGAGVRGVAVLPGELAEPGRGGELAGLLGHGEITGRSDRPWTAGPAERSPGDRSLAALPAAAWPDPETLALSLLGAGGSEAPNWLIRPLGQAAATGSAGGAGEGMSPGSACAVALITGDAQLGATGTVTLVEEGRVAIFGHPFLQRGPVAWPLAAAEVLTVLPSRQMSFKMGTMGGLVGTIDHDQRAGLSGRLGPVPVQVPVTVQVSSGKGAPSAYAFAVADDPFLTPTLVFWCLYNTLLASGDDASLQTLDYAIEIDWTDPASGGGDTLLLEGVTAGPGGVRALGPAWMAPLSALMINPDRPLQLTGVRAVLKQDPQMRTAAITGLSGPRILAPGQASARFQVDLQERRGRSVSLEIELPLPAHLQPGTYRVAVASAADFFALETQRLGQTPRLDTVEDLVDLLRTERSPGVLQLALVAPGEGLVVEGREMPSLPGSFARVLESAQAIPRRTLADLLSTTERSTPWLLEGSALQTLVIQAPGQTFPQEKRP